MKRIGVLLSGVLLVSVMGFCEPVVNSFGGGGVGVEVGAGMAEGDGKGVGAGTLGMLVSAVGSGDLQAVTRLVNSTMMAGME